MSGKLDVRRKLDAAALERLNARYALARANGEREALLAIGRDLHAWIQGDEGWLATLKQQQPRPFLLEIRGPLQPNAAEWAVLHAPWELLAEPGGTSSRPTPSWACAGAAAGTAREPPALDRYRLGVAFMAAAPRGQQELDFEAEEAAIMAAAGERVDLLVEESGNAEELPVPGDDCAATVQASPGRDGKPPCCWKDAQGQEGHGGATVDALGTSRGCCASRPV